MADFPSFLPTHGYRGAWWCGQAPLSFRRLFMQKIIEFSILTVLVLCVLTGAGVVYALLLGVLVGISPTLDGMMLGTFIVTMVMSAVLKIMGES